MFRTMSYILFYIGTLGCTWHDASMPSLHGFLDLDLVLKNWLLLVHCMSCFHHNWLEQSSIPEPWSVVGRASCVLLRDGRYFSRLLNVFNWCLPVVNVWNAYLQSQWPCALPIPRSHKSPSYLMWCTLHMFRTFADLYKCQQWWQNWSCSSAGMGSLDP